MGRFSGRGRGTRIGSRGSRPKLSRTKRVDLAPESGLSHSQSVILRFCTTFGSTQDRLAAKTRKTLAQQRKPIFFYFVALTGFATKKIRLARALSFCVPSARFGASPSIRDRSLRLNRILPWWEWRLPQAEACRPASSTHPSSFRPLAPSLSRKLDPSVGPFARKTCAVFPRYQRYNLLTSRCKL